MDAVSYALELRAEARESDQRRTLVLAGERKRGYETLERVLDALTVAITETTLVGPEDRLRCPQVSQTGADQLLGTTRTVIALDVHDDLQPNALGRVSGAVDGGGLLLVLAPPLEEWPDRRGRFARSLAVPPYELEAVTGRFERRLVETIRTHRGVAVFDVDDGSLEVDGSVPSYSQTRNRNVESNRTNPHEEERRFPAAAYERCLTDDQRAAVETLETVSERGRAVVLESDRGRGKSSAAGLAAGGFALEGRDVLVTAPSARNAAELFDRARELIGPVENDHDETGSSCSSNERATDSTLDVRTDAGGRVRFLDPDEATDAVSRDAFDGILIVDEAAALPVSRLESFLSADRVAFATTIHGYEGAGRGFTVRFRNRLEKSDHELSECELVEPIRYAAYDPVEVWSFRALGLDARPPVEQLVTEASPETVSYRRLEPAELLENERLLGETFGLLVLAHYRTEPNDLARLLDAPNLEARALVHDGHVVSVALLAREGNLSSETRAAAYEGTRIRGNMLPDILTSELRDESAGELSGLRVVRIATHHAVRSRGLGSTLLEGVRSEFEDEIDWLGTAFGATPGLLEFWDENEYGAIHLSTTRNDASGEHSVLMLSPTSETGRALADRHSSWFARRFPAVCSDSLVDLEPDVIRSVLRTVETSPRLELTDHEWRLVAAAAYGPGRFDADPGPFRELVVAALIDESAASVLSPREQRLLVARVLQGRDWKAVADDLEYHSAGHCRRALGEALRPLVDRFGTDAALEVRERFDESK